MNLILFGSPGVGKGTQAVELVKKYNLTHISTGEMFREVIAKQTAMGQLASSYISKGIIDARKRQNILYPKVITKNTRNDKNWLYLFFRSVLETLYIINTFTTW